MKRFLLVIPVLLILLNACGAGTTAAPPTPTLTPASQQAPMHVQEVSNIFNYLNRAIEDYIELKDKFSEVEHITGATYQITSVAFPLDPDNMGNTIFHVEARCECAGNAQCCSTTRTFVFTLMALDDTNYRELIINQVDTVGTVKDMEVWTYDHANHTAVASVPWNEVKRFLRDEISGFQFAAEVEIR